jgi:hypothetical protein
MYDKSGKPVVVVIEADADFVMDPISDSSMPSIDDPDFRYFFTGHMVATVRPLSAPVDSSYVCTSVDLTLPVRQACFPDGHEMEGAGSTPYLGANRVTVERIFGQTNLVEIAPDP